MPLHPQLTAVPDGEYLLQNAANSVLGKQLISLAKKRGIKTINLVPSFPHLLLCSEIANLGSPCGFSHHHASHTTMQQDVFTQCPHQPANAAAGT